MKTIDRDDRNPFLYPAQQNGQPLIVLNTYTVHGYAIMQRKRSDDMSLFHRKKQVQPIPAPFTAQDIRSEASTCTGERTVGFYDRGAHRLRYAELVRSEQDIRDFYAKYGLEPDESILQRLMKE